MKATLALVAAMGIHLGLTAAATETDEELLQRYYPGVENMPGYAGSFVSLANETHVADGIISDFEYGNAAIGVLGFYTVGGGYEGVKRAIETCNNVADPSANGAKQCMNDGVYAVAIHTLGLLVGGNAKAGVAWIWNLFAARTPGHDELKRMKRTCGSEDFTSKISFKGDWGIKLSCKAGCVNLSKANSQIAAFALQNGALLEPMALKNAGAFQFTITQHDSNGNFGKPYARCHAVWQLVHPNTCPSVITGSGCATIT